MQRLYRRALAVILSLALVMTLLPLGALKSAFAAGGYFTISSFSKDMNNPTTVNQPTVDITGTFSPDVKSDSIRYKLEQVVGGVVQNTASGVQAPIISGNTFKFTNVQLFAGMNRIIIEGKNSLGNIVATDSPENAYVYFSNVPVIYDLKLIDGVTPYDSIAYVDEAATGKKTFSFMFHAPNTDQTSINGYAGVPGGGDLWIASGIPLEYGLNEITIVASNTSQSYTVKRQAVLFNGLASFGVTVGPDIAKDPTGNGPRQSLEGKTPPVIGPTSSGPYQLNGDVKASYIITSDTQPTTVTANVELLSSGGAQLAITNVSLTNPSKIDPNHWKYDYTVPAFLLGNPTIASGQSYTLRASVSVNGQPPIIYNYPFVYRDPDSIYIKEIDRLYGVTTVSPNVYDYTSKSTINTTLDVLEAPLSLGLLLGNSPTAPTVTVDVAQDGTSQTKSFSPTAGTTFSPSDGEFYVVQIPGDQLFPGLQTIKVTVDSGTSTDFITFKVNYVPAPTIQLMNVYNGQIFNNLTDLTQLEARFTNFAPAEITNTAVFINGIQIPTAPGWQGPVNNIYTIGGVSLNAGANTILVYGVANGIPIEINYTVYVFPPGSTAVINDPVPSDSTFTVTNDLTVKRTGDIRFSTTDKDTYFYFTHSSFTKIQVKIDGNLKFDMDYSAGLPAPQVKDNHEYTAVSTTKTGLKLRMKDSGPTSITVTGITSFGASVTMNFEVVREVPPYQIVSPLLPSERVINQNFWLVKIKSEKPDSILINKEVAKAIPGEPDTYGVEVKNLKSGKNTIKFTVTTAGTAISGSFDVYYANQNTIGAQYKTPLGGNSISAFNKAIEIKFPKNTLFRNEVFPYKEGPDNSVPYLFDKQQVRFGMASQANGTVEKKLSYPTAGKSLLIDSINNGQYMFAGPLFWVDAGYYDDTTTVYQPVDGLDPYTTGDEFFNARRWLKPTNRGEITIQYDPAIRDVVGNNLSIWKFNYRNNTWENIGGVVNTSKKTITAEFDSFGYYAVMMLRRGYGDVQSHAWGREFMETIIAKGIMSAKNSSEFGAYDLTTRGEFAQVLVKAVDLPLDFDDKNLTFYDVPNVIVPGALYDYRYIETAFRKGVVRGTGPGTFNPTGSLTREEAAVMIARAVNAKVGSDQEAAQKALSKLFTDSTTVDFYAAPSVLAINKLGIMKGSPNAMLEGQKKLTFSFNPQSPLTRAEAATIAYKMMQYLKKLPK